MVLRVSLQEIKLFILRIMDTLLKMSKPAQIWKLMKLNLKYITYHYLFLFGKFLFNQEYKLYLGGIMILRYR